MKANVLSLGAGVQSSALLLLYLEGKLKPMPDFAVFADTQCEPPAVYVWLEKLKALAEGKIEIIVTTAGSLIDDYVSKGKHFAAIPFFLEGGGIANRQCTTEYKIAVIRKAIRKKLGYKPYQRVKHKVYSIIGISRDEIHRMRDSRDPWITNKYPLIEELNWTRNKCWEWLGTQGLGMPTRSACIICPYRSNIEWRELRQNQSKAFDRAVAFDKLIRHPPHLREQAFIHRSLKPLDEVDFGEPQPSLFDMECEGMCGV